MSSKNEEVLRMQLGRVGTGKESAGRRVQSWFDVLWEHKLESFFSGY